MLKELEVETVEVRLPEHLKELDALIIPGGESTTIGKLATEYKLIEPLREFVRIKPTLGYVCRDDISWRKISVLMSNRYLGQWIFRSIATHLDDNWIALRPICRLMGLTDDPFHAVFIRAPVVTKADTPVKVLSQLDDGRIVAVQTRAPLGNCFSSRINQ